MHIKSRTVITGGWQEWAMKSYCLRDRVSDWQDEKVSEMDSGGGCTIM